MKMSECSGQIFLPVPTQGSDELNHMYQLQKQIDAQIQEILQKGYLPFVVTQHSNLRTSSLSSDTEDLQRRILYNRKDKSLSELTKKFLNKYEGSSHKFIILQEVTKEFKIERRRIYDIINIMESLNVISKKKKNVYQWKGLEKAVQTIDLFQDGIFPKKEVHEKKHKSLEILAGDFMRLFIEHSSLLTLEEAADLIYTDTDEKLKKTKIRRLYDIINVHKCLGLVRKVHIETGKNGFQWLGVRKLKQMIESMKQSKSCRQEWMQDQGSEQFQDEDYMSENNSQERSDREKQNCCGEIQNIVRKDSKTSFGPFAKEEAPSMKKKKKSEEDKNRVKIEEGSEKFDNSKSYFEVMIKSLNHSNEIQKDESLSGLFKSLSGIMFEKKG